ncbi:hypothetical protein JYT60_01970 [bacterium AH-315-C08]|nr:hypothetical protein [bacterium AH-315-C08]
MSRQKRDHSLDLLLELAGQILVLDPAGKHWVKFTVKKIEPSPERPHGLNYSLTLHDESGERLVGFDNAPPVRSGSGPGKKKWYDHKHRKRTIKPYDYSDSVSLLTDFWAEVDKVLKEKGVIK